MSKKGTRIKAKLFDEVKEYYKYKITNDSSGVIIPKIDNKEGRHLTLHPSGKVNYSSQKMYQYDIFNNPKLKEYVEERLKQIKKIENPDFALILDMKNIRKFVTKEGKTHFVDMDSFFDECEEYDLENNDYSFTSKFQKPYYEILIFTKDDKAFFGVKSKPGYGIPFDNASDIVL